MFIRVPKTCAHQSLYWASGSFGVKMTKLVIHELLMHVNADVSNLLELH